MNRRDFIKTIGVGLLMPGLLAKEQEVFIDEVAEDYSVSFTVSNLTTVGEDSVCIYQEGSADVQWASMPSDVAIHINDKWYFRQIEGG